MTKGQIIFGVSMGLLVGGTIYFGFVRKYSNGLTWYGGLTSPKPDDFASVQKNLGVSASGDILNVKFNSSKNTADFYKNNRVIIGQVGKTGYVAKGTYSNGGLMIILDNGKIVTSGSVWQNLLDTIK